jgi:Asp-tRNA(Asn)/Glu-tRNA(Gln) amidotransferase A subunit family amidase
VAWRIKVLLFRAGYNGAGLPIGVQVMGRAWQEQTLLWLALAAGQAVERRLPQVRHRILDGQS